jgi:16S rRNA (adenine1518-N6/adenine1519-N6)-dimethyltransferase
VELAGVGPDDAVIEVGPGLGQLTRPLARAARRVVALEVDRGIVRLLQEAELPPNVEIRHQDALQADLRAIALGLGGSVLLVGNLPYSIAGRLLGKVLEPNSPFRRMGLMLQAEVADRVLAEPGTRDYGPLAVFARLWARATRMLDLGPEAFEPRPRVRSTFVVVQPVLDPPRVADPELLREVVRCGFQQRRKTLRGALRTRFPGVEAALREADIDPVRRAETLSEREVARLANALHAQAADA